MVTLSNTSVVFCPLQCIYTYVFKNGALSTSLLFLQSLQVPCQVTGVTLKPESPMDGKLPMLVTWTAPRSYANITMYYVQHRRNGTSFWGSQTTVAGSPPPTCSKLKGLTVGTLYDVRVKALSSVGHGLWSAVQTGRTYDGKCVCIVSCCSCGICPLALIPQFLFTDKHCCLINYVPIIQTTTVITHMPLIKAFTYILRGNYTCPTTSRRERYFVMVFNGICISVDS